MGKQARLKASRRALITAHRRDTAALHAASIASPEYEAEHTAAFDEETAALTERDRPGQETRLRHARWCCRVQGSDGLGIWDHNGRRVRLIHSLAHESDGHIWSHLSVSREDHTLPGWYELRNARWLLYPDRTGIIVLAPQDQHVDIGEVLHAWTRLTGPDDLLPDFRHLGQI